MCTIMRYCSTVKQRATGFTLIEVMVVLAIIAILALLAIPSTRGRVNRAYIGENLQLIKPIKQRIDDYYTAHGSFPADNDEAGLPEPPLITGNYLSSVEVTDGALQLTLGQKIGGDLKGKVLSVRPVYVPGSPGSPISWICGYDGVPDRMSAAGDNLTNIERGDLPLSCL